MRLPLLALALALGPTFGLATETGSPGAVETVTLDASGFTYAMFEPTIEHADLATCPPDIDMNSRFCRMTLASEMAHVFVFELEGDQPLVAIHSYELSDGLLNF